MIKKRLWEDVLASNKVTGWNTVEIWTTAPLPYLLIPVKTINAEKAPLTDMQNHRAVC